MKFKNTITLLIIFFMISSLNGSELKKRPRELLFFVNSHLVTTTVIEYNDRGGVVKMTSSENNKLTDYARYKYGSDGRLSYEKSFTPAGILTRTRVYFYDASGLISGEKVYSPDGTLIEYLNISYSNKRIVKIEYYKADNNLYQTLDFKYTGDILYAMAFDKIGKYILIMKAVYDENMLLVGHDISHSGADVIIKTKYIYEDGFADKDSLQIIFR